MKAGGGITRKRNLGEDDFRALNAVFNGIILKLPDQSLEKNVWPSTLRFTKKTLLCGQIRVGDINIVSSTSSGNNINANVRLTGLNVVCSAAYSYQWGWFGGSGRVSAGGRQQSVETAVVLGDNDRASIASCTANVDLGHLSFSGGIVASIADTFKSFFGHH